MAGEEAAPLLPPQPPPPQLGPPPRVRGGVGATASGLLRRVSWLSEETPLFLESVFKPGGVPLFFSEEDALVAAGAGRFLATGEAAISKVFWDGFCWERASFFAARLGYGPATLEYALLTGLGGGIGVFLGQFLYSSLVYAAAVAQKLATRAKIPTPRTLLLGLEYSLLIATAALLTGCCWQPVANGLAAAVAISLPPNARFATIVASLTLIQGAIFFVSLHGSRILYSHVLQFEAIDGPFERSALVYDSTLAVSLGGAAGLFFATEGPYATNVLTHLFGVFPQTSASLASFRGGMSYVVGFSVLQCIQNVALPRNTSWADLRKKGKQQLKVTTDDVFLPYRTPFG